MRKITRKNNRNSRSRASKSFFHKNAEKEFLAQNENNKTPFFSSPTVDAKGKTSKWGAVKSSVKDLSNGDLELTESMPFAQTIPAEESVIKQEEAGGQGGDSIFIPVVRGMQDLRSNFDSISTNLTYLPSVSRGGTVSSSEFGITNSGSSFANIKVNRAAGTSVFNITGELVFRITWQVHSGTGPGGQVDIGSSTDSDITAANYLSVARDLKPNASGRAPRSNFWAEDLTIKHEKFHAYNQRKDSFGPQRVTAIQNWLNSKTVASAAEINATMLRQALNEGTRVFNALVALPSTEGDAYADGKASYLSRSNAIKTKGDAGGY